ncbi:ly6/PLAUR domain-containing protein 2-like [Xenopus tropicalis]|uniref:Ly6/PLAUR domain-containing protein 2-like n=1 Tax=Xenopus tropicalis TaxID=8364 RepID=A0A8J0R7L1_XENTR|nr:ly6/PLAUR domain-containing protein 2-like [Xenopus tropicalis]|eukprot:XP_004919284.1 PREDICTED: ly6/PLAUR domain-containing protein 2-like [Xenopus tropicalis]
MATLSIALIVTALCAGSALSLKCYTCTSQSTNANCKTEGSCNIYEVFCRTNVVSSTTGISITKSCATSCAPSSVETNTVACCSTDLCNLSGATGVSYSSALLALSLGFALVLVKNSLQ